jgi:hypothetical protein
MVTDGKTFIFHRHWVEMKIVFNIFFRSIVFVFGQEENSVV